MMLFPIISHFTTMNTSLFERYTFSCNFNQHGVETDLRNFKILKSSFDPIIVNHGK